MQTLRLCLLLLLLTPAPLLMNGTARAQSSCAIDVRKPETLILSGRLTYKIFPGPPNYEDVRKGDRPEGAFILQLDKPACATIALGNEAPHDTDMFSTVHLLFDGNNDILRQLRSLKGRHVTVEGENGDEAMTGHHHAPFIMDVKTIRADKK